MAKSELELWIEKITKDNQEIDLTNEFEACLNQMEPDFNWERIKDEFMLIGDNSINFARKKISRAINSAVINETNIKALFKIAFDSFRKHTGTNKKLYLYKVSVSPVKWDNIENVGDDNKGYRHLIMQFLAFSDNEMNEMLHRAEADRRKREMEEERERNTSVLA